MAMIRHRVASGSDAPMRLLYSARSAEEIIYRREIESFAARKNGLSEVELVGLDSERAHAARRAYSQFGKGRHRAGLNYGDCFSYALATVMDEPLLYKGDEFTRTDVITVRLPGREPEPGADEVNDEAPSENG
jgi:ribonuclease VapC